MYQAPHEVRDNKKLENMIESLKAGKSLPAVIVCGEVAFSGSHRLAAYDALDLEADVFEIEDEDIQAAMEHMGLDPMYDQINRFDDFVDSLYALNIISKNDGE